MKKNYTLLLAIIFLFSCEKESPDQSDNQNVAGATASSIIKTESINNQTVPGGTAAACTITGTYVGTIVGTSPANNGIVAPLIYQFMPHNFVRGAATNNNWVSFGGCRVTCDSVIWYAYGTLSSGYFLHKGKFSNNRNTITGTWINENNPLIDYGNLTITKQ